VSHLTKTETSVVIWLNIVTIVAQNVADLPGFPAVKEFLKSAVCPHACTKMSMPLLNCIVNDGLVNAMPNMQKMLLQFTTLI